jgi:hypothetical protein
VRRFASVPLLALLALAVAVVAPFTVPAATADDPPLITPSPLAPGADAMIRARGTSPSVGSGVRGEVQQVQQDIPQFGRAVFLVRACVVGKAQRIRLHGAHSTFTWKVRYRVGRTDVTRSVVSGTYRTSRLRGGACSRVRMIVRLQPGQGQYDHVFTVRATPRSGAADAVSGAVHITGVIVVP